MTKTIFRRLICSALFSTWSAAYAQAYPDHTISIIVPVAAGGPQDAVARIVGRRLSERLGKSVIIYNAPGASGAIGATQAARAQPDGYTLYLGVDTSMAIMLNTRTKDEPLPFKMTDLIPIGGVSESAFVFVTGNKSGLKDIADLVAAAKKTPGGLSYGSAGVGSATHLPVALFAHRAGISLLHVPYKGSGPAMLDTIANLVTISAPGYTSALRAQTQSGQLIPLAVTSLHRLPFLPNVPTLVEQGYPDMVFSYLFALFAPKGTPKEVILRLSQELATMDKEPEFVKALYEQGNTAVYVPPEALDRRLADETNLLTERLRASGISLEH